MVLAGSRIRMASWASSIKLACNWRIFCNAAVASVVSTILASCGTIESQPHLLEKPGSVCERAQCPHYYNIKAQIRQRQQYKSTSSKGLQELNSRNSGSPVNGFSDNCNHRILFYHFYIHSRNIYKMPKTCMFVLRLMTTHQRSIIVGSRCTTQL